MRWLIRNGFPLWKQRVIIILIIQPFFSMDENSHSNAYLEPASHQSNRETNQLYPHSDAVRSEHLIYAHRSQNSKWYMHANLLICVDLVSRIRKSYCCTVTEVEQSLWSHLNGDLHLCESVWKLLELPSLCLGHFWPSTKKGKMAFEHAQRCGMNPFLPSSFWPDADNKKSPAEGKKDGMLWLQR